MQIFVKGSFINLVFLKILWKAKLSLEKAIYKNLLVFSLALFVVSIFRPWLLEHGWSPFIPSMRKVSQFWSYQVVISRFHGASLKNSLVLMFQEFWFFREFGYPEVFQGWILVFLFQILAVTAGAISTVKEKVKGKPLPLICTIACVTLSLLLCYFQFLKQSTLRGGYAYTSIYFDMGFFLALISGILWTVPLWIYKMMQRKIVSLVLLLIATAIPTVLFITWLVILVRFYIRMNSGDFLFDWNRQLIGVTSQGVTTALYIPIFLLGLICIPLFFTSILFLYKEWQIRRKHNTY
jgi:hypothetical protein